MREVVLVDREDNEVGRATLRAAHKKPGILHRAFSLVLYRKRERGVEILVQKRAKAKPVFPGYWANTCCYNMGPGEEYLGRATTRVWEEMGVAVEKERLKVIYKFEYYAEDEGELCERELDTVIVGEWDGEVKLNPEEASDYRWILLDDLVKEMKDFTHKYSPWFRMIVGDPRFRAAIHE